jgi:hypothetical protein
VYSMLLMMGTAAAYLGSDAPTWWNGGASTGVFEEYMGGEG